MIKILLVDDHTLVRTGIKSLLSTEIATQLALKQFTQDEGSPFDALSERELQIALMTVQGRKPTDIAEEIHISPKTVNSYRYRIFDKLKITSDVELTHYAVQHGLLQLQEKIT